MYKNYNIDGNKEMIAFGMMNILGSFSSCYLTTGNFILLLFLITWSLKSFRRKKIVYIALNGCSFEMISFWFLFLETYLVSNDDYILLKHND